MSENETFLDRWARRKRAVQSGEGPDRVPRGEESRVEPPRPAPGEAPAAGQRQAGEVPPAAPAEADLPLPSLDDLTPDSDLTAFMAKGVSEELRRLAMRKMWTLDPTIRDFVEMAENQYNFNDPASVPGFGVLAPGTDMERLVAHARGMVGDAPAAEPALARAEERPGQRDPSSEQTGPSVEEPPLQPVRRSDEPASGVAVETSASEPQQTEAGEGPPPSRRRHGGALPI